MNTTNLDLVLTPDSPGAQTFKAWRKQINGESNSNMIKIDEAIGELYQKTEFVRTNTNLEIKFANEIANFSNVWEWIQARIQDRDYNGINIGDFITFTANNNTYNAHVAGINVYTKQGDTGNRVENHIDFISRELWPDRHRYNAVNYNNGTAAHGSPYRASDLYYWLNSLSGTVPNSATAGGGSGTAVDYTSDGVYYYLPAALKSVIVEKTLYIPSRYDENSLLTDDNGVSWVNLGKLWLPTEWEVCGGRVLGTAVYSTVGNYIHYPIFRDGMNCVKSPNGSSSPDNWWLLNARSGSSSTFARISSNGVFASTNASVATACVPICFRIA